MLKYRWPKKRGKEEREREEEERKRERKRERRNREKRTSMKREMLVTAWSVSLNTSLQVRAVPGARGAVDCLARKLERSSTVHDVPTSCAWK